MIHIRKFSMGALAFGISFAGMSAPLFAQGLAAPDAGHVMHTSTRDEGFRGVEMTLEVVDALSDNQKANMMESYRQQYRAGGFDLNHLPQISYQSAVIDRGSKITVGSSVFTIRSQTQSGPAKDYALMLYGIDGATYNKVLCYGVTNVFKDTACLKKAQNVFGPLTISVN